MRLLSLFALATFLVMGLGCSKTSSENPGQTTIQTNPAVAGTSKWTAQQLYDAQTECAANGNNTVSSGSTTAQGSGTSGLSTTNYAAFCGCIYNIIALNFTYSQYLSYQDAVIKQVQAQGIDTMCLDQSNL